MPTLERTLNQVVARAYAVFYRTYGAPLEDEVIVLIGRKTAKQGKFPKSIKITVEWNDESSHAQINEDS